MDARSQGAASCALAGFSPRGGSDGAGLAGLGFASAVTERSDTGVRQRWPGVGQLTGSPYEPKSRDNANSTYTPFRELTHLPHFARLFVATALALLALSRAHAEPCTVDHCHDGDTCTLVCADARVKVRLHCIDAPEMSQAPWGANSRDYLRQHARSGAAVELVSITRDKYQRTVGVLLLDGVNLNLNQVHAGWAVAYPKYCAEPIYYQAQEDAAAARRGVWASEGEQQRPWEWRRSQR